MWGDTKALLAEDTPEPKAGLLSVPHKPQLVCTPVSSPHSPPGPFPPAQVSLGPVFRTSTALSSFPTLRRSLVLTWACWRTGQARNAEPDTRVADLIGPPWGLQMCTSNNFTGYWCGCPGTMLWQLLLLTRAVWTFQSLINSTIIFPPDPHRQSWFCLCKPLSVCLSLHMH